LKSEERNAEVFVLDEVEMTRLVGCDAIFEAATGACKNVIGGRGEILSYKKRESLMQNVHD
jgi:hypothetical protein